MSGLFSATVIKGNRITDFGQTTATVGIPIPFGYGSFPVDGNVIWAPMPPKEHRKVIRQGKGGVKQETFTYTLSYAVAFARGQLRGYKWIKRNGKVVYTTDPTVPADDAAYSAKWAEKAQFHYGTKTQLPDSLIESYEGSGQVSAFRDLGYITVEDDDVTGSGGAMPSYEACVIASSAVYLTTPPYPLEVLESFAASAALGSGSLDVEMIELGAGIEEFEVSAELVGGALAGTLREIEAPTESFEVEADLVGSSIDVILVTAEAPTESFEVEADLVGSSIDAVLVSMVAPDESFEVSADVVGGSLV